MNTKRRLLLTFFAGWAIAMILSLVMPALSVPAGDGFMRDFNRVATLVGWQALALTFAIFAAFAYATLPKPRQPVSIWLGLTPIVLSGLATIAVIALIIYLRSSIGVAQAGLPELPQTITSGAHDN